MDLYCPICTEPWDNDSLHEEVDARKEQQADNARLGAGFTKGTTYDAVAADFRSKGCRALTNAFGSQSRCKVVDAGKSATLAVIYELSGDDMDGAMSDMDDAIYIGLL